MEKDKQRERKGGKDGGRGKRRMERWKKENKKHINTLSRDSQMLNYFK